MKAPFADFELKLGRLPDNLVVLGSGTEESETWQ